MGEEAQDGRHARLKSQEAPQQGRPALCAPATKTGRHTGNRQDRSRSHLEERWYQRAQACEDDARRGGRAGKASAPGGEILQLYSGGTRAKRISLSDETWVDRDTCRRLNPQNDRTYFPKGAKKDEVLGDSRAPLRQPTPGIMVRVLGSSAQHGVSLKPHFFAAEKA